MKKAIVIGATGLIGKEVVNRLLQLPEYEVIALVRKPSGKAHKRLNEVVLNFDHPEKADIVGDEVFCCLGTTIKDAGSKEAFYKVDFTYVFQLAKLAHENGATKFALVSSMGADENSRVFYNKTKGAIEKAISGIGFKTCFIFRPSLLLGNRSQVRTGERVAQVLMTALSFLIPARYKPIEGSTVAHAMVAAMRSGEPGFHVLTSDHIRSL